MHPRLSKQLPLVCAAASFCIVALLALLAGAAVPNYSHLSQFISELGARGAPFEWQVRIFGFLPSGILLLIFCFFAHAALPRSRTTSMALMGLAIYAAGYVVAAAFPCDLGCRPRHPSASQIIHNLGGLAGYLIAPAFLFALARQARDWPAASAVVLAGHVASALALIGLILLDPSSPVAGLGQRLLEAAVLTWAVVCGHYISSRSLDAG